MALLPTQNSMLLCIHMSNLFPNIFGEIENPQFGSNTLKTQMIIQYPLDSPFEDPYVQHLWSQLIGSLCPPCTRTWIPSENLELDSRGHLKEVIKSHTGDFFADFFVPMCRKRPKLGVFQIGGKLQYPQNGPVKDSYAQEKKRTNNFLL